MHTFCVLDNNMTRKKVGKMKKKEQVQNREMWQDFQRRKLAKSLIILMKNRSPGSSQSSSYFDQLDKFERVGVALEDIAICVGGLGFDSRANRRHMTNGSPLLRCSFGAVWSGR